jgi:hypothetical protein
MLDADLNAVYWGRLTDLYTSLDKWLKVVVAVASSGTVAAWGLWEQLPLVWKSFSAAAVAVSIVHPILCSAEQLKRTSALSLKWRQILAKYQVLWTQDKYLSSPQSLSRYEAIVTTEAKIDEARLPKYQWLARKAFKVVCTKRGLGC